MNNNIEHAEIIANCKEILLDGVSILVNENGDVFRKWRGIEYWRIVENVANHSNGYNVVSVNKRLIRRHRIIAYAFLGLDITNPKIQIDHIDGNKLNNCLSNLRCVNHQQNQWNQTKAKGYYEHGNKFRAQIKLNGKKINLGTYETKDEARTAYLNAKLIYHIIE